MPCAPRNTLALQATRAARWRRCWPRFARPTAASERVLGAAKLLRVARLRPAPFAAASTKATSGVTSCTLLSRRGDGSNDPLRKPENTQQLERLASDRSGLQFCTFPCCTAPHQRCTLHLTGRSDLQGCFSQPWVARCHSCNPAWPRLALQHPGCDLSHALSAFPAACACVARHTARPANGEPPPILLVLTLCSLVDGCDGDALPTKNLPTSS